MTMNDDVILEILSHCPSTEIRKFRLLNKECNKRSYESSFINLHLKKTNSVFGYFIHYDERSLKNRSRFVSGVEEKQEKTQISLEFLPPNNAKIEACDTNHGILLCVDDKFKGRRRIPDYIVCKPATKEYRIIPNPKTRFFTFATGLMVVSSNPFRYKIVRVSEPKKGVTKKGFYNHHCEVFDSDSFAWKRLKNLETPEIFPRGVKPVSAYGCLHWLTEKNNVIRFSMRTETWSIFPVPDDFTCNNVLILVNYEGKLGVIHSNSTEESDLWVLEKSFGTSWVKVKDRKITALEDTYAKPVWFLSNDVVSLAGKDRLGLYNMNSNNCRYLHKKKSFYPYQDSARNYFIPFYSNYERVGLNKDKKKMNIYKASQHGLGSNLIIVLLIVVCFSFLSYMNRFY
ncbi:F-box protein [Cardamine amara subsp. amara]|uniref:F-box protein n=1 Tax=Cardamine amara subsp. amara TaxID=228776 RepID=A0ABD0ZM95_CARAN